MHNGRQSVAANATRRGTLYQRQTFDATRGPPQHLLVIPQHDFENVRPSRWQSGRHPDRRQRPTDNLADKSRPRLLRAHNPQMSQIPQRPYRRGGCKRDNDPAENQRDNV